MIRRSQIGRFYGYGLYFCLAIILSVEATAQSTIVIRPTYTQPLRQEPYSLAPKELHRPKVGLVLTGGGARGIAHIGALKVLERHKIPIDFIAGNSIGAIVGGLYAAGYSVTELESLVLKTNWNDLLALTGDTRRSELYLDQKQALEQSFLLIRLEGLQPLIPSSLSGGQRLINFLTELTLQALYHPQPEFDDLKIPFRAVATDLISGRRVVLDSGSLAEALRASITVPLLFTPLERDSMSLVDGGLVSNIPVDLARSAGCEIVITSNSTSGMRTSEQLEAPWETADQIMSIMMQSTNEIQLKNSDIVLTPDLGNRLSSDFTGLDQLIAAGEKESEIHIHRIAQLIDSRKHAIGFSAVETDATSDGAPDTKSFLISSPEISFSGDNIPTDLTEKIVSRRTHASATLNDIEDDVELIYELGWYEDVFAEITTGTAPTIRYVAKANPLLRRVQFRGHSFISRSLIEQPFSSQINRPIHYASITGALEEILSKYRDDGYSLARIDSLALDSTTGTLSFVINEGIISGIIVQGNGYTKDYVIRREFDLEEGDPFVIRKAQRGLININSTGLFEYVLLDVQNEPAGPVMILKVKERGVNNVRLGLHADNERGLNGLIDLRDPNLFGTATELGFTFSSGVRNRLYRFEYRANRIFNTYLTFNLRTYFRFDDAYSFEDALSSNIHQWERLNVGEYRQIRGGGTVTFGAQFERLGNLTGELRWETVEINRLTGVTTMPDKFRLVTLKLGTVIDTEDRYPFPTSGIMFSIHQESALQKLGSERSYGKLTAVYESYFRLHSRHTIRPRITIGVADETLPLSEQFSLGGLNSFFGLREEDSRGRQLFLTSMLYRFAFPFRVLFDTYLQFRYDLGMISGMPEEIRLNKFRHGIGAELALDTPIGPASIAVGRSFYFRSKLADRPLSLGPVLVYFSIGYRI